MREVYQNTGEGGEVPTWKQKILAAFYPTHKNKAGVVCPNSNVQKPTESNIGRKKGRSIPVTCFHSTCGKELKWDPINEYWRDPN